MSAAADVEARRRQLDVIRRHDDAKLAEARRENEALRRELDQMMSGDKRTDVALVSYESTLFHNSDHSLQGDGDVILFHIYASLVVPPSSRVEMFVTAIALKYAL